MGAGRGARLSAYGLDSIQILWEVFPVYFQSCAFPFVQSYNFGGWGYLTSILESEKNVEYSFFFPLL